MVGSSGFLETLLRKKGRGLAKLSTPCKCSHHGLKGEKVYSLTYVDDVVLLVEVKGDMRAIMARLERYVRGKGLEVNVGK